MKTQSIGMKFAFDKLYSSLGRTIYYTGFPFHELAARVRDLIEQYGAKEVAAALNEMATFEGWRVMLNKQARTSAFQLLGPPPEKWDRFYRHYDGTPAPRPPGRETPPVIPPPEIDPILDGLVRLAAVDLERIMKEARTKRHAKKQHEADLAREQLPRIASEMVRRGIAVPPDIPEEPSPEPKKPRRAKKAASGQVTPEQSEEPADPLRKLTDAQLQEQLQLTRSILLFNAPDSFASQQAREMAETVAAEMRRRGLMIPQDEDGG